MIFCHECGEKLDAEAYFCVHCGEALNSPDARETADEHAQGTVPSEVEENPMKVSATDETTEAEHKTVLPANDNSLEASQKMVQNEQAQVATSTRQHTKEKKTMTKKAKVIWGSLLVLVLALFGTHKALEAYFDPIKELKAMEEAISSGDQDAFISYIDFEKDVLLDEKSYFDYIKEKHWDDVREGFLAIMEAEKQNPNMFDKEITDEYGDTLFKVKNKKHLGIYDGYELYAVPTKLVIYSNLSDATVTLSGQEIAVETENEEVDGGDIYSGAYEAVAKAKGEYGDITLEETVEITAGEEEELHLAFDFATVDIMSSYDFEDAYVFIDGKKTDFQLHDNTLLRPFPLDKEMKIHAEWKNDKQNVVRSNTVQVDGETDYYQVYFEFDDTKLMSETVEADLKKDTAEKAKEAETDDKGTAAADSAEDDLAYNAGFFVLDFRDAYEYAVNDADYGEVKDYLKPDSNADKELKKFIDDMEYGDYYYDFEENTVTDVKQTKDGNYKVKTTEKFMFIDKDNKSYDYNREKEYLVELVDDTFYISKIEYTDTKKNKKN